MYNVGTLYNVHDKQRGYQCYPNYLTTCMLHFAYCKLLLINSRFWISLKYSIIQVHSSLYNHSSNTLNKSKYNIELKGMHLNQDFYVVVGKQCRQKMRRRVTNTISLYKLTNVHLSFICFKLVIVRNFVDFIIYFHLKKNILVC